MFILCLCIFFCHLFTHFRCKVGTVGAFAMTLCLHMVVVLFVTFTIKNESAVFYCDVLCCDLLCLFYYIVLC